MILENHSCDADMALRVHANWTTRGVRIELVVLAGATSSYTLLVRTAVQVCRLTQASHRNRCNELPSEARKETGIMQCEVLLS